MIFRYGFHDGRAAAGYVIRRQYCNILSACTDEIFCNIITPVTRVTWRSWFYRRRILGASRTFRIGDKKKNQLWNFNRHIERTFFLFYSKNVMEDIPAYSDAHDYSQIWSNMYNFTTRSVKSRYHRTELNDFLF